MGFRTSGIWGTIRIEVRHESDHKDYRVHTGSPDSRRCCLPSMRLFRVVSSHSARICLGTDSRNQDRANSVLYAFRGVPLCGFLYGREGVVPEPLRGCGCLSPWKHVVYLQGRWKPDRRIHRSATLIDKLAPRTTQSQASSLGVEHTYEAALATIHMFPVHTSGILDGFGYPWRNAATSRAGSRHFTHYPHSRSEKQQGPDRHCCIWINRKRF